LDPIKRRIPPFKRLDPLNKVEGMVYLTEKPTEKVTKLINLFGKTD